MAGCSLVLGTLKMVECACNRWLFAGGRGLSQTIKQMQQRMLELKKTLQKELVSSPLLPTACALPGPLALPGSLAA